MRAIVTVLGKDRIGIISAVSNLLAENQVNILDISQTILQDYFTMIMLVDTSQSAASTEQLQAALKELGLRLGLEMRLQHEDIFNSMHRV